MDRGQTHDAGRAALYVLSKRINEADYVDPEKRDEILALSNSVIAYSMISLDDRLDRISSQLDRLSSTIEGISMSIEMKRW